MGLLCDPIHLVFGLHPKEVFTVFILVFLCLPFCLKLRFYQNIIHKKRPSNEDLLFDAENEGFEPPVPHGTIVFKTTAIDHSANSPLRK